VERGARRYRRGGIVTVAKSPFIDRVCQWVIARSCHSIVGVMQVLSVRADSGGGMFKETSHDVTVWGVFVCAAAFGHAGRAARITRPADELKSQLF
jgi:hypothetical protein